MENSSIHSQNGSPTKSPRLHEILTSEEIDELYTIFKNANEEKFTRNELKEVFAKFHISFDDDDFENLFLKMNTNRDDHIDWNELISHLLLGFQADDPYTQKETLNLPIEKVPITRKSLHNFPIIRIRFCPTVLPDRSINNTTGNFITASKDGTLIWWNPNFEYQRTGKSKNISLRVAKTWILDFICLPDVRVICTSSIERDLRFYDMSASNFQLRIVISSLPFEVTAMHYWYGTGTSTETNCKIVLGDADGNVILIEFNPELRGPFQSKPGTALIQLTWREFLQGKLPLMKITNKMKVHQDIVQQVEYSEFLNSIISAAECRDIPIGRNPQPGLVISELGVQKHQTIIKMFKGVTCFAFDPICQLFATGGPDCILRLWNHIVPAKPIAILPGHHSGIIYLFIQDGGQKIYTIDKNKTIKIWDAIEQNLQQTYIQLITAMPDKSALTCFYHDTNRELIIASMRIITINCLPLLKLDKTDGYTHSKQVSVILYNDLFKSIVTCGLDSYVIVWNPWTGGKRITLIKNAHTRIFHGEIKRVEITAACFDPKKQLLLTGARNGTMKMWNFNNGICMRNLSIEHMCEVTAVFWMNERILAMGWNKHVIEFSETGENEHGEGKYWDTCHREDILAAAVKEPQTLATASYGGELVLWKLESGQPYRRYSVENPTARIKIVYDGQKCALPKELKYQRSRSRNLRFLRRSYMQPIVTNDGKKSNINELSSISTDNDDIVRRISIIQLPLNTTMNQSTAVHSMVFLNSRPMQPNRGTLCLAIDLGIIQVYSHHDLGGFMDSFNAIHLAGDCVVACSTDRENRFLFTGTVFGYVKIWLIENYCVPAEERVRTSMPKLRIQFPFLWKDRWEGRAKRTVRHVTIPLLCNSYKAHVQSITDIMYLDDAKLVVTSSSDFSVRIWTLSGQYIGTLGSPVHWQNLSPTCGVQEMDEYNFRIPPDIQRVASSTTLKVLKGGDVVDPLAYLIARSKRPKQPEENETETNKNVKIYGDPISEPILGKNLKYPNVEPLQPIPKLDKSLRYHPVYSHLNFEPAKIVQTCAVPALLTKCQSFDFMATEEESDEEK